MRRGAWLAVLALAVASCGSDEAAVDDDTVAPVSTEEVVVTTDATAPDATATPTTTPSSGETTPAATTPIGSTTPDEPCVAPTGADPVSVDFPLGMSSLVGRDIRTGTHPCFERVVLELQGTGELPGYRVEYVADPVRLSPSDEEVDIAGEATLVLSVAAWMTTMEGDGYTGPGRIVPTNVDVIEELRLIENFEGMHQWAIGLQRKHPFVVSTLASPPRIVIDIAR